MNFFWVLFRAAILQYFSFCVKYLQVVVDDLEVSKLGKRVVRRQRPLHHELDLPRVGLEAVTDLEADSPHHYIHEVLNLKNELW